MKKILAVALFLASTGSFAQALESSLSSSATVITGVVALSAPVVLLVAAAAGTEESLDTPTQTMPSVATSTAR